MWTFLALIAGPNWPSLQRPLYLLLALVLLLSGLSAWWLAVTLRNLWYAHVKPTLTTEATTDEEMEKPLLIGKTKGASANKALLLALATGTLGLIVGTGGGWVWRDQQFSTPLKPYFNVLVEAKYDNQHFVLAPERMAPWKATTCQPVDWEAGEKMQYLTFEQHLGCKDVTVKGWYKFYTDEDTGRRLKFRKELANAGY